MAGKLHSAIFRNPAAFGFCIGILYFLWKIALLLTNLQHQVLTKFPIAPLLMLMLIGILYFVLRIRKESAAKFAVIGAFKAGMKLSIVTAAVSAILVFAYYKWMDTDYLEIQYLERLKIIEPLSNPEEFSKAQQFYEFVLKPHSMALFTMSSLTAIGLLYSLATSILARFLLPPIPTSH
jgi:hypothetical protein